MVAVDGSLDDFYFYVPFIRQSGTQEKRRACRGNAMTFKPRSTPEQVVILKDLTSGQLVLWETHAVVSHWWLSIRNGRG